MKQAAGKKITYIKKRPPSQVMRLSRMGAFHASRLSFMRVILRKLRNENWQFDRPLFDIDANGVGVATYRAKGPERTYTLVAFAHDLPDEKRSDRVIADAWDATFALVDGEPTSDDIVRLSKNVPLQEAGRVSDREFVLSRANRSVRLFNHVLSSLASGEQPQEDEIDKVGYLMRTTAVYGSGKFGAADRERWADRSEFSGSFQPEMLSVWLIRSFAIDLLEHLAQSEGGKQAVTLDPHLRRRLGIGNSTGLGMAPFLINHPSLIHAWINAREEALCRVRNIEKASKGETAHFTKLLKLAMLNAENWHSVDERQNLKVEGLRRDLKMTEDQLATGILEHNHPWNALYLWAEKNLDPEGQEQIVSLMLEPYGEIVDDLAPQMSANERQHFRIDGTRSISEIKERVRRYYDWAFDVNFASKDASARIWYVSEEKLEPRLGERFEENLDAYEQALAPARDAMKLYSDLSDCDDEITIAGFLMERPEHRHIVRRLQVLEHAEYGEIHDNTIDAKMLPIDLLRCKLSFFGATKFDPRSDRWVRIAMYQHAPYPDELASIDPDQAIFAES